MTDRERKNFYLNRIRQILISKAIVPFLNIRAKKLEEELKIIMWNNSKDWTETFMEEEVIPLLRKYGIKIQKNEG